jgi:16S rRNA (uracil1498-N3)-methyltransferase
LQTVEAALAFGQCLIAAGGLGSAVIASAPRAGPAAALRHTARVAIPRVHVDLRLEPGAVVDLPPAAARHVQVLRLQPGAELTLFDGRGGEWAAAITAMGRRTVQALVRAHRAVERELALEVTLAVGVPANDRMDTLVEKAAELGAAALQPLATRRSVLRVDGDRAARRRAHWQAVAAAACEQCGRNRVPTVAPVLALDDWLRSLAPPAGSPARLLLSFAADARPLAASLAASRVPSAPRSVCVLSGPEGGLAPAEEDAARVQGFRPVTLGARVLRADTAPLAALAWLALHEPR